jgi:AraC-like DNA-binding protein
MRVRGRQSFASWKLPRALDGLLLLEDLSLHGRRYWSQDRHSHDELELHLIERGHAVFLLPEHRLEAPAGTLLWIPPGHQHLLLEVSSELRRWLLLVRRRVARRVLPAEALNRALHSEQVVRLAPRALNALRTTFMEQGVGRSLTEAPRALGLVNAGIAYALARAHLIAAAAAGAERRTQSFHSAVVRALSALRASVPPPSLPELAALSHTSQAHLSKLFSAQVGMSITEFRNHLRLQRFFELYGDGRSTTLLAAALDAGFGSYAQFHRVFKQHIGHAPGRQAGPLSAT